jgi:hypothetical protein
METIAVDGFEVLGSNSDKAVGRPLATRNQRTQITLSYLPTHSKTRSGSLMHANQVCH